jgi:hypothetical protein
LESFKWKAVHLKLSVVRVDAASFFGAKSHGGGRKNEPTAHSLIGMKLFFQALSYDGSRGAMLGIGQLFIYIYGSEYLLARFPHGTRTCVPVVYSSRMHTVTFWKYSK